MSRAAAWRGYAIVALALALLGAWHWVWAVTLGAPVLYGEGAVAHAALLAQQRLEYTPGASIAPLNALAPLFTAANYPPLYFSIAGLGAPFVVGRLVSIAATLFVALAIAWRARGGGRLVSATIALAWLGSVPVLQWAPAVKPDLLSLALTVGAVVAMDRPRPRCAIAGGLIALAALTKPTALLPGIALLVFALSRDRRGALIALGAGLLTAIGAGVLTVPATAEVWTHVVDYNALPWHIDLAAQLMLIAVLVLIVPITTLIVTRPSVTAVSAYVVGAVGILLLGGREGATINYFLDLSAALALAIAGRAPRVAASVAYPIAAGALALLTVFLVNPFGVIPGRGAGPGAWGDPARVDAVRQVAGPLLVEDSGLVVANAVEPVVDDVFLWSRNRARSAGAPDTFPAGPLVLTAVRDGRFAAVVSEVDLARLDAIGGYERQRWAPDLVQAVLDAYPIRSTVSAGTQTLYLYRRP